MSSDSPKQNRSQVQCIESINRNFYQRRLGWTFLELSEQNRKQRNLQFSFAISFLRSFDQVTQDLHMLHLTWIIRIVFVINVKLQLSIDWCYYKANINIFQDLTRPAKQNKPFITCPGSAAWPDDHHSSSRPPPVSACQRCAIQRQSQAPSELS